MVAPRTSSYQNSKSKTMYTFEVTIENVATIMHLKNGDAHLSTTSILACAADRWVLENVSGLYYIFNQVLTAGLAAVPDGVLLLEQTDISL